MRNHFPTRAMLTVAGLFLAACGDVNPPPPVDDEGDPIPLPGPYDTWLTVADVAPREEISTNPEIEVTFSDYLDDDRLLDFATVSLVSGGLRFRGRVRYVVREKKLVWRPFGRLPTGLTFRLRVDEERLRSATGSPILPRDDTPAFVVVTDVEPHRATDRRDVLWPEVEAILERKCTSCHRDDSWGLNPLTRPSLVGGRSEQTDRILVRAFDPADSYLMHKILPDYVSRRYDVQPPPWSRAEPLTSEEVGTIEDWIAGGARP